jgi:hypothetical protein
LNFHDQTVALEGGIFTYTRDLINYDSQPNQIGQFLLLIDAIPLINNEERLFKIVNNMKRAYEEFRDLPSHKLEGNHNLHGYITVDSFIVH